MPALQKRDHIIDIALNLFYQDGFNATGVEKIIQKAQVSKKTLYNHFKSKDELILAVLRKRDEQFRNKFMRAVESAASNPRDQLLAMFDILGEWFKEEGFSGCMFINASAEFSDHDNPNHIACAEHYRLVREYIRTLAEKAGAKDPSQLASQIHLLIEGAIVDAHVCINCNSAQNAKNMADVFISLAID